MSDDALETLPEAELVARAQAGDAPAVEALLARHLPALEGYVRLRSGGGLGALDGVSDLVQSTCRELLTGLDRFRFGEEQAFRHWLYATAARKIADRHRYHGAQRRERGRRVEGDAASQALLGALGGLPTPSECAVGSELLARLEEAFGVLGEDEREVVLLSRVVGLSRAEVARALGRTEAATRNLLHRSLGKLAARIDADEG